MNERLWPDRTVIQAMRSNPYDRAVVEPFVTGWAHSLRKPSGREKRFWRAHKIVHGVGHFFNHLDRLPGLTLDERWPHFERHWVQNVKGRNLTADHANSAIFLTPLVLRLIVPSREFLQGYRVLDWIRSLVPSNVPLRVMLETISKAVEDLPTQSYVPRVRQAAVRLATEIVLSKDYWALTEINDADLRMASRRRIGNRNEWRMGSDALDAALCMMGLLDRTHLRGIVRKRRPQIAPTVPEMVRKADIPGQFREVTCLYLENYRDRISSRYGTLRSKIHCLARFWRFIASSYPSIKSSAEIRPEQARAYIPQCLAITRAAARRGPSGKTDVCTANHDLAVIRTFFSDIGSWSSEEGSSFGPHVPPAPPLTFRDTQVPEVGHAFRRREAAMTRRVIDLEREMPRIRAVAFEEWQCSKDALASEHGTRNTWRAEAIAFWNWAFLELLVQSGLRIEEAHNLTVFDILKRIDSQGRVYFLLHVEPSKFDKGRLIPIGDSLGKVLSEIIIHVKRFYGLDRVPPMDHFDFHEQKPLPRAPYLLQGRTRPHMIGRTTIRSALAELSQRAGARCHDGQPLNLAPHDCRRVFASEHLNNGTPPHVLRALLGHERLDTVMIYAKLYPGTLVEEYRRHVRGVYQAIHGADVLRAPTEAEWTSLARSCDLRDMGTHLCALPTGDHCPKGLVCLGCVHAQPKKSALPLFQKMRANHARELVRAEARHEPLGQLASRRLELARLDQAVQRAQELSVDVAQAMEDALAAP